MHLSRQHFVPWLILLLSVPVLLLSLASCQASTATAATGSYCQFVDDTGATVILLHKPQRVVALMGSYAEMWELAGGTLAGVTDDALTERHLQLDDDVAVIGSVKEPNLEQILNLAADFVLLSTDIDSHKKLDRQLSDANIPHAYFHIELFDDYLRALQICTGITGDKALYQLNGLDVKTRIDGVLAGANPEHKPAILLIRAFATGAKAKKDDNMTGRMLADLGCDNIASRHESLLEDLSIEAIIGEDPEYIFIVVMGESDEKAMAALKSGIQANPAWNQLAAVKQDKVIVLPKDLFHYKPNARWDEAYAFLANILNQ